MVSIATIYGIIKFLAACVSLFFGIRKLYKLMKRKLGKRKPTA